MVAMLMAVNLVKVAMAEPVSWPQMVQKGRQGNRIPPISIKDKD